MLRALNVIWVGLMVAGAVVTYAMKDRAGRAADHVMELRREISREKDLANILRAEWSVLDQPARLQELVGRYSAYLHLEPLDVRQLASLGEVPDKPIEMPGAGLDRIITSGVTKSSVANKTADAGAVQAHVAIPRPRNLAAQSGANP